MKQKHVTDKIFEILALEFMIVHIFTFLQEPEILQINLI